MKDMETIVAALPRIREAARGMQEIVLANLVAIGEVAAPRGHRLNTRELLYTGATRARSRLVVWAEPTAIEDGAMRRTERHGRLADRIARLRES